MADVGPGVERRGGQRQHHDSVPGRDVLQLLFHGPEERNPPRRLPVPELNRDVPPFGHRLRVLEEMLGGQVGHQDRVLAREPVPGRDDGHPLLAQQRLGRQAAQIDRQP